ncbi:hypothetical protein HK098_005586 [Nowakowskiella sp. JEL0407]|nr:hypothetical protein HK098_005586 [Nowakowskiella sp. JEL0407]
MDLIDNFFLTIANDTETTETNYLNSTCYPINPATDMLNNQLLVSSHENTSFWLFAHFQFISVALAFCVAVNYRKPFWTNILFTFHIVLVLAAGTAMVIAGDTHPAFPILKYLFGIREGVSDGFRTSLGVLAGMNLVACILWEVLVVEVFVRIWLKRRQELFDLVQKKMGSVLDGKITKMLGRGALVQYFSTVVVAARETGGRVAGEFSEWTNRRGGWGTSVTSFWGKSEAKSDEVPLVDKIPEDIENGQSELNEITRCANFG